MAVASKYAGRNRKADGSLMGPEDRTWAERLGLRVGYSDYWLDPAWWLGGSGQADLLGKGPEWL
jgi:hypothetical protein